MCLAFVASAGEVQRPRASRCQPAAPSSIACMQSKTGSLGLLRVWASKAASEAKSSPQLAHSFRGFNGFSPFGEWAGWPTTGVSGIPRKGDKELGAPSDGLGEEAAQNLRG